MPSCSPVVAVYGKVNRKEQELTRVLTPIGFAVFLVHLATIPITGTGINPARSLGAAIIFNKDNAWDDHWVFWVGPFIGAALAALYHVIVIRAIPFKSRS
ncbi:hypothetical protein F2Q69_00010791 [Brassica cretica]|uniref:Aquaporin n=1 Tax=Brassica cretica TaxID=69181 RepID=A0A8S9R2W7_BRACR|nr:hypothetical protein F2Q69_00010791 [Brassica cretica]